MIHKKEDIYFLSQAFRFARDFSQDANSQTGALIVNPQKKIISKGTNRIHYGMKGRYEGKDEKIILMRPEKYIDLIHAERDSVYVGNRKGISLEGCTIYATWTPCEQCAEIILNNGIKRFVTHKLTNIWYNEARKNIKDRTNWTEPIEKALALFEKGQIQYKVIEEPLEGITFLFDDKIRTI